MSEQSENGKGAAGKARATTDEERAALGAKLDRDLDEFIAGLEKRSFTEGWPEDRWQEEMEKHPFFTTKQLNEGDQMPPLIEGLQQLKYDSSVNSPEELAANYKEDGNFNFKCKNYRKAIISYTEGLKQKCGDMSLNAQLYNNRAACNFILKNYRSSYNDCKEAIKANMGYPKAQVRLAQCCYELGLYEECVKNCDLLLRANKKDEKIQELRRKADTANRIKLRDERKEEFMKKKAELDNQKLLKVIQKRGIQFLEPNFEKLDLCETLFPDVFSKSVHLVEDRLVWPVVLMYPEYKLSDFIQEFHEDCTFMGQLEEMFRIPPEWDSEKKYTPKTVKIYFEDSLGKVHLVNKSNTLGTVLSDPSYRVDRGTPVFIVLVRDSKAEQMFLKNTR